MTVKAAALWAAQSALLLLGGRASVTCRSRSSLNAGLLWSRGGWQHWCRCKPSQTVQSLENSTLLTITEDAKQHLFLLRLSVHIRTGIKTEKFKIYLFKIIINPLYVNMTHFYEKWDFPNKKHLKRIVALVYIFANLFNVWLQEREAGWILISLFSVSLWLKRMKRVRPRSDTWSEDGEHCHSLFRGVWMFFFDAAPDGDKRSFFKGWLGCGISSYVDELFTLLH